LAFASAAAKDQHGRAEPGEPAERLFDVRHLRVVIGLGTGHLQRRGQEQVGRRRRQADRFDCRERRFEGLIGQRSNLGRAQLDVIEAGCLCGLQIPEPRAVADRDFARRRLGRG
jgi:hypothetical protein